MPSSNYSLKEVFLNASRLWLRGRLFDPKQVVHQDTVALELGMQLAGHWKNGSNSTRVRLWGEGLHNIVGSKNIHTRISSCVPECYSLCAQAGEEWIKRFTIVDQERNRFVLGTLHSESSCNEDI